MKENHPITDTAPISRIFRMARAKEPRAPRGDRREENEVEEGRGEGRKGCSIISIERDWSAVWGVGRVSKMGVNTRDNLHSVIW